MVRLDDCIIIQPEHLVGSILSRDYDSVSIQNLNISQLCMLK
jgi:hypothetical protein